MITVVAVVKKIEFLYMGLKILYAINVKMIHFITRFQNKMKNVTILIVFLVDVKCI